ncbi:MAG: D-alanine--D-alanine ligase [Desulfobacterales bacterium]|nr:MAG: D-alanine--D-alanine ligase [Desulfobacterales bacterium]
MTEYRDRLRLALLAGGDSPEREVSLSSGAQVAESLDPDRYDVRRYDPRTDLGDLVRDAGEIDAALLILHGPNGEDGTIQGLLDLLGIPYQGSGVLGSAMAMNKKVARERCEQAGLPAPSWRELRSDDPAELARIMDRIGIPLVVKPAACGSSIGMSIVRKAEDLPAAARLALSHDNCVLAEAYISGAEITAGVMGNEEMEALPPIEIIPGAGHEFFDYNAKYVPGATEEICPARIPDDLTRKVQEYALRAHRALELTGYSRSDFILSDGEFYLLETNTIPGMTATSLFPQAAAAAGYGFSALLDHLIELGMDARRRKISTS